MNFKVLFIGAFFMVAMGLMAHFISFIAVGLGLMWIGYACYESDK